MLLLSNQRLLQKSICGGGRMKKTAAADCCNELYMQEKEQKKRKISTRTVATYGLLIAVALVLSYLESLIPPFFAIPGMKVGLTNLVVLIAMYLLGTKSALCINIVRVLLVGLLFGNAFSLIYSIAGAFLSWIVMILLKKTGKFSIVPVSIAGGVFHNIGQILVAMFVLHTASVAWYLLILWFSGIAAGAIIGLIGGILVKRLEKVVKKGEIRQ